MISQSSGRQVALAVKRGDPESITATCLPRAGVYNEYAGEATVCLVAVGLVVLGAWHGVEDLRRPHQREQLNRDCFTIEERSGLHFVVFGSLLLAVLFCFKNYLMYALSFLLATSSVSTSSMLLEPLIGYIFPALRRQRALSVPGLFASMFGIQGSNLQSDACASLVSLALVLVFLLFWNDVVYGWIFQDLIAAVLVLTIQRSLRLPNLKLGTGLILFALFFEISYRIVAPLVFKKSTLMKISISGSTGQTVPMVLKIPAMNAAHPKQFIILGLSDVAIPGMFLSMLLRHDLMRGTSGLYFPAAVIGYAVGLALTFMSFRLLKHTHPTLLFLAPGVLLPTFAIAQHMEELAYLWDVDYGSQQQPRAQGSFDDGPKDPDKHV